MAHYRFLCLVLLVFTALSSFSSSAGARPLSPSTASSSAVDQQQYFSSARAQHDHMPVADLASGKYPAAAADGQFPPMFPGGDDNGTPDNGFSSTFSPNFPGGSGDDGFMNNMPPLPFGFPSTLPFPNMPMDPTNPTMPAFRAPTGFGQNNPPFPGTN